MAKRPTTNRAVKSAAALERPAGNVETSASKPKCSAVTNKRQWLSRLALVIGAPLCCFLLLEGVLRLSGYGYATSYFIPGPNGTLTTNPKFAWQYYPVETATTPTPLVVSPRKAPGTKRVVVLGESAAAGTPDPAYSFSRILGVMLETEFPSNRVEIVNAAMRGIDSYMVQQIAEECAARLEPDLFIVYTGNNDLIGLHSPDPNRPSFLLHPAVIATEHAVVRTKGGQLLSALMERASKSKHSKTQTMEHMRSQALAFDDPRRHPVYKNFKRHLEGICAAAQSANAKVLLCTVAVNLRDFPPLQSLHRNGLSSTQLAEWDRLYASGSQKEYDRNFAGALGDFEAAARIDDHHATLLYRLARCEEALGQIDSARKHFSLARDWDALQFRTDSRMNEITRRVAKNAGPAVSLVDLEDALAQPAVSPQQVPGGNLFQEHVHFYFAGDYAVASALTAPVRQALQLPSSGAARPSLEACAEQLAYTPVDASNVKAAVAQMTKKPPFFDQLEYTLRQTVAEREAQQGLHSVTIKTAEDALTIYNSAIARHPNDWFLHYNKARLLTDMGLHERSLSEYEFVTRLFPKQRTFRHLYGLALLHAKRERDAAKEFYAALELDPNFAPARQALQQVYASAR